MFQCLSNRDPPGKWPVSAGPYQVRVPWLREHTNLNTNRLMTETLIQASFFIAHTRCVVRSRYFYNHNQ